MPLSSAITNMGSVIILPEISYKEFCSILDGCFPEEKIDKQVFLNNISNHQFLFASHESSAKGYLLFDLKTSPARLIQLCVDLGSRSLGIGSFLIDNLKGLLLENDVTEIILNVDFENNGAIRFYQKHGFTKDSTNTQFSCHPSDMTEIPTTIKIVQVKTPDIIQKILDIGTFMTRYISESQNNLVYSIVDKSELSIGHFLYNPEEGKISHFVFENPEKANELVQLFKELSHDNDDDLLIESLSSEIDHYLSIIPGMVTEYRLQVMKFSNVH